MANIATGFLTSYLGNAVSSVADKASQDIYQAIKARFQNKAAAQEALDDLEKLPGDSDTQAAVRLQLKKIMAEDESFVSELKDLLQEAGNTEAGITVIRQIAGDDATQIGQVFGDVNFR